MKIYKNLCFSVSAQTGPNRSLSESPSGLQAKKGSLPYSRSGSFLLLLLYLSCPNTYRKIYFRINNTVRTYISTLIFLSFAFPVRRFSSVQEITPMAIPSEML